MESPSEPPLAPTAADLAAAERIDARRSRAPQRRAEAVVADDDRIRVLCSAGTGAGEHSVLLLLAGDGTAHGERGYDPQHGVGRALAASGDVLAVAGEVRGERRAFAPHIMRLGADGEPAAERTLDADGESPAAGTLGPADGLAAIALLADGAVVVGGARAGRGWLAVLDEELRPTWEAALGDEVVGVAGLAAAAVRGRSTTALGTAIVAAYEKDGNVRWEQSLNGEPAAIASAAHLVVAGHVERGLWAAALDGAGEVAWERTLAAGDGARGRAVAALADGGVVIAGDARSGENRRAFAARLHADGTVVWERALEPRRGHEELVADVAAAGDGVVLVGTTTAVPSGRAAAQVRRLDADGELAWERAFEG